MSTSTTPGRPHPLHISERSPVHRLPTSRPGDGRLYCFPYAGGSAGVYRPWAGLAPPGLELAAVQLPGRQERWGEPYADDLPALARSTAGAVLADLHDLGARPYGLYGHSMGALLAYETARELCRRGAGPALVTVSGHRAPQTPSLRTPYRHLPDDELLEKVIALGGTVPELATNTEFLALVLPMLRADFTMAERYRHLPGEPLPCPLLVLGGSDDPYAPPSSLDRWTELSHAGATIRVLPGGHFFQQDHAESILGTVAALLARR
ncbi:thioesterase II family protein [Actinoplanes sp. CA-252034]|uniref:thioesterase II family protein n=1 Tax=Actinoplanes sp. CA-252034 TaxID=3239906 RepID=UPI003D97F069